MKPSFKLSTEQISLIEEEVQRVIDKTGCGYFQLLMKIHDSVVKLEEYSGHIKNKSNF